MKAFALNISIILVASLTYSLFWVFLLDRPIDISLFIKGALVGILIVTGLKLRKRPQIKTTKLEVK
jgi:hypothetical protein